MSAKCPRSILVACLYDLLDAAFDLEASQFLYCPCLQLGCVPIPWRKLCFSSANGAMQSNCSMKQRLCSENPMWNSRSRFPYEG